jgi:hypothetical protein
MGHPTRGRTGYQIPATPVIHNRGNVKRRTGILSGEFSLYRRRLASVLAGAGVHLV